MSFGPVETRTHDYVRHGTTLVVRGARPQNGTRDRRMPSTSSRARISQVPRHDRRQRPSGPGRPSQSSTTRAPTRRLPFIGGWHGALAHLHFNPTSSSWLNLVERWFALLSEKQIKRGTHRSTRALETAIRDYIEIGNESPKLPSSGPSPPTKSSINSATTACGLLTQDTSGPGAQKWCPRFAPDALPARIRRYDAPPQLPGETRSPRPRAMASMM